MSQNSSLSKGRGSENYKFFQKVMKVQIPGICVSTWNLPGICLESVWNQNFHVESGWNLTGIYLESEFPHGICLESVWNLAGINIPKWNLSGICRE